MKFVITFLIFLVGHVFLGFVLESIGEMEALYVIFVGLFVSLFIGLVWAWWNYFTEKNEKQLDGRLPRPFEYHLGKSGIIAFLISWAVICILPPTLLVWKLSLREMLGLCAGIAIGCAGIFVLRLFPEGGEGRSKRFRYVYADTGKLFRHWTEKEEYIYTKGHASWISKVKKGVIISSLAILIALAYVSLKLGFKFAGLGIIIVLVSFIVFTIFFELVSGIIRGYKSQ